MSDNRKNREKDKENHPKKQQKGPPPKKQRTKKIDQSDPKHN